jgi:DNA polymerase elongation subunit (family B)
MEQYRFFPYSWHINEKEEEVTSIRVYGLDSKNENVCIRVDDFTPFVYLELPENIPWTASKAQLVGNKLDSILGNQKPLLKKLMYKKRLYYANLDNQKRRKTFPYLFLSFSHHSDIRNLSYKIRKPLNIIGVGVINVKMHEQDATPILQFTSYKNISPAGWVDFSGKRIEKDDQISRCDHEFKVKWKNVKPNETMAVASPLIMGFDIEVNSSNPSAMPKAEKLKDKVFQISCVLFRHGDFEENMNKFLLTLGEPDPKTVGEDVEILMYETEADLLKGYTEFIQEYNPNIIIGYNILNFDIPYMIERAKMNMCIDSFDQQGFDLYGHAQEKTIKWSSSAYGNQTFQFLDAEGRLYVDLLPLVKRDYKMDNYQLKTISTFFLKATKDPLSVKGIFKCYRIGIKHKEGVYSRQATRAMGIVGKYCYCEGTQISLIHGNIPIEQMVNGNNSLLSWDEKTNTIGISEQLKFFNNGIQECIELELEDGRKITCTPDHLIANENGEWIKSEDSLNIRVKVGPILPNIVIDTKDMILSRILGYLSTDGHIGKTRCIAYIGNLMDANILAKDIQTLCGVLPKIGRDKNCHIIEIPSSLSHKIRKIIGTNGNHGLPDMTSWNENSMKEFLGGLFGGDGWCPSLTKENKFTSIGLTQSRNSRESIVNYINIIVNYLKKFNISSSYRVDERINDDKSLYIGQLIIPQNSLETFVTTIGYRYCYHKTLRASVAVMYYRIRNKARFTRKQLYESVMNLVNTGMSVQKAYNKAMETIKTPEYMPKYRAIKKWVRDGYDQVSRQGSPREQFPTATKFVDMIGANCIYEKTGNYHTFSMKKEQITMPVFSLNVIEIKEVGKKQVYDIEVKDTHAYMAEGLVVHNCVQDSVLVIRLFNKLQTWIGLCEMAKTCHVPIFYLYTQGQQIKVYSQLYRYCLYKNFVVEKDGYTAKDNEHYVGATVFEPIAGVYDKVLPFDFCLGGDTLINIGNGCSKRIDSLLSNEIVLGYKNGGLNNFSTKNGLQVKGLRNTVKIFFQDGSTIVSTPDHKFMLDSEKWCRADELKDKYVMAGLEYTVDTKCDFEDNWELLVNTIKLDMKINREKSLAFARMLGYICISISKKGYTRKAVEASFGTLIDANNFMKDMMNFCDVNVKIRKRCGIIGVTYNISLPSKLATIIHSVENISIGKRSIQQIKLPTFILDEKCPLSIVREFLGGLYGGDGTAPYISKGFSNISFKWTVIEKYINNMSIVFDDLMKLHSRLQIKSSKLQPSKVIYSKDSKIIPKDIIENPRYNIQLNIPLVHTNLFQTNIGFRYCVNKSTRLSIASSYQRMSLSYKNLFPSPINYIEEIGAKNYFSLESVYADETIPCYRKKVIDVRDNGNQEVFDIEVNDAHNFMANGIITHNCSLYPTTIIAYNIDYSTLVIDPKVPDSDCHVMEWQDCVGCSHDKTVRKTKPKHVMCEKRYFRFLKEPKGVMPTVLQNLLDARVHTRKQNKVITKIIEEQELDKKEQDLVINLIPDILKILDQKLKIPKERLSELKTLIDVLDKRQLAYKVSANSMYGAMGVTRGYLPFMPGAMCCTAMGRKNIHIAANTIVDKFGGKLIYGDSVTADTPVLCKIDGKTCYRTIDNLPIFDWTQYKNEKEEAITKNVEIWTENGFTKVRKVIKHKTTKEIFRVLTHSGVVDVTEDHGLLNKNGDKISPKEIKIGSELLTHTLPDVVESSQYFNEGDAFVMGLFYANGSCRVYGRSCHTWAINKDNLDLLNKCIDILNKHDSDFIPSNLTFKIMESSFVYKLVPTGKDIRTFIKKWRCLFYDKRKYKKVPDEILWSSKKVRQSFMNGYYAGDGDNKGKLGASGLYYLASSLGYKVSINTIKDNMDIYRLTCTKGKQSKKEYIVKKLESLGKTEQYVYDLETENHHFSAGIGKLIVHNTDSNYVVFPHLKTAHENWDHAVHVAEEITKLFPKPISLEFEQQIYWRFFILTKKRYMYKTCKRDGIIDEKIGKKGVLLARRDNSMFIKNAYETLIMKVFNRENKEDIIHYIIDIIDKLCSHFYSYKDFIVTKSVGSSGGGQVNPFINEKGKKKGKMGDYTVPLLSTEEAERKRQFKLKECSNAKEYYIRCLPAVVQLAERMRERGQRVDTGTRLEYVISSQGGHKAKQYVKVEDANYFGQHSSVLKIDYMYYLKLMTNPFDDVLNVLYNQDDNSKYKFKKDFVLNQYKYILNSRTKVLEELKNLFQPKLIFK